MIPANLNTQTSEFAQSTNMTGVLVNTALCAGVIVAVTVTTPSAGTFTASAATDLLTKTAHGAKTGLKVQVSTTLTLPAPLAAATDYFVIFVDANNFKLAATLANANAGTAIDLTTDGTGVQTITPTGLAGCSFKLQGSHDNVVYADIPIEATGDASKSASVTASANFHLTANAPCVNHIRVAYTMTAGQISISQQSLVKVDF